MLLLTQVELELRFKCNREGLILGIVHRGISKVVPITNFLVIEGRVEGVVHDALLQQHQLHRDA